MSRNVLSKLMKAMVCALPLVLFFSYWPVIRLGGNESMNFELSLPLVWLVIFDIVVVAEMVRRKVLFKGWQKWWVWLLFPVWLTVSVFWSLNFARGVLTVGILWLIYVAIYGMWRLRGMFDGEFRRRFWWWFFGATMMACAWCVMQCVMDLAGVGREYTLMCEGCTYRMFGFPHPNGFAIEPQFMGNLLLAPAMAAAWLIMSNQNNKSPRLLLFCLFAIVMTLFLTFSRGAIYAFVVGAVMLSIVMVVRERETRRKIVCRVGVVWGVIVGGFVLTLCLQGLMAEVSPTHDTFGDGVARVLNQLSLGVVDIRGDKKDELLQNVEQNEEITEVELVENPVENNVDSLVENSVEEEAVFDGYVAESTDTRVRLTGAALSVWAMNPKNMFFGVGLGGAGFALYVNDFSPAPKEIVQNEYASLLLETGIVGITLLLLTVILIVKMVVKQHVVMPLMVALLIVYGVTLFFFSGLPNALQVYLMPGVILAVLGSQNKLTNKK